ncbi:MAG: exodeoxyribonuclease VII large subunit [Synergistaceae bacterium]|nr:exodeoxyribonuclease VII large subunit [Synergistaceae bacterium]
MSSSVNSKVITVDEMTGILRDTISSVSALQDVNVRGEILGFKRHTSGHTYFSLLGSETRVSCVLFRSNASSVITWPKDGDEVLVKGRIDIYGARGSYQIYANVVFPIGAGAKARAKEMLRVRLEEEGIFDPQKKLLIPKYPEKLAIITSLSGAALQDFLKISSIRYPNSDLVIIPSLMQGIDAQGEILSALNKCRFIPNLSLIVLIRGGGSRDDLDVFDNEDVVRAIFYSPIPVVTGLGHQIDNTLSDLAADLCSPTPSSVAEHIFPDTKEIQKYLQNYKERIFVSTQQRVKRLVDILIFREESLIINLQKGYLEPAFDNLKNKYINFKDLIVFKIHNFETKLKSIETLINSSSPRNILNRGYSISKDSLGNVIKDPSLLKVGDIIYIESQNTLLEATIKKIILKTNKHKGD